MIEQKMIEQKAQHQPSPMSEATLWRLYRRLLGERLLMQHLEQEAQPNPAGRGRAAGGAGQGSGILAALGENLLAGDTVGLTADDLVGRYLCGVPLAKVREAAQSRAPRRMARGSSGGRWAHEADADHGLLPGTAAEQASLALGTALAARLHRSGSITVLVGGRMRKPAGKAPRQPDYGEAWAQAAQTAVALQLPLLFVSHSAAGDGEPESGRALTDPRRPAPLLPSIPVDRDDALALYRVIYESAARARSGGGPTWIECLAWMPARPARQAPRDKHRPPLEKPALEKMEEALRARKLFSGRQERHLRDALEKEFAQAGWPPLSRS